MKRGLATLAALVLLAGCGGGSGSVPPGASSSKTQSKSQAGSMLLSIPLAAGAGVSANAKVRYPQFVSPNASSVAMIVNGGAAQDFDVSATSALCTTTAGARNCTLPIVAPAGNDTFAFTIYAGANATGAVLSTGSSATTVVLGTPFTFTVAMNAVIGTIVASIPNNNNPSPGCPNKNNFSPMGQQAVIEGCPGSGVLGVTAFDPSGAQITGTAPYTLPIVITASDPAFTAAPAQIAAPGQTSTLSYAGAPFAATTTNVVTFNLTIGTQVIPAPLTVIHQYLYVANSNALPGTTPPGGGDVAVYPWGATAGTAPARTLAGANTQISNPVDPIVDAAGNLYVLDNGPYTSNSNPVINVFAPGANGNVAPVRQITQLAALTSNQACEAMTFDPTGKFLYVTCDDATIHVFPVGASGPANAAQVVSMICDSFSRPVGVAFDPLGNLYVADPGVDAIFEFAAPLPSTGNFVSIFPANLLQGGIWPAGIDPLVVAFDTAGDLYASIVYVNPTAGPPDANNQLGIWKSAGLPCMDCVPAATLGGAPFTTHAPGGVTLDAAGDLYLGNQFTNQVNVFSNATLSAAMGATNNPPVLRTINTGGTPSVPTGMSIGP